MQEVTIKGFEAFRKGSFENGGQNLYVSKKGVLQRIWRFDVDGNGYVDLAIANSHDYTELPPLTILHNPLGEEHLQQVLTHGSQTADVADLRGTGTDDLVIAAAHDGQHEDLASYVYFGGKDGITEDRRIDLSAPFCRCCGIGDFDGDGKKEICYLVGDTFHESSPNTVQNTRLRIYHPSPEGFRMNGFTEVPTDICYFTVGDVDGDGRDDLICRTGDGKWLLLWGEERGFSRPMEFAAPTDDNARFNTLLPFGGGNLRYDELTRPKFFTLKGERYLFYANAAEVRMIHFAGRNMDGKDLILPVTNVIAAGLGHLEGAETEDLVLLQINSVADQHGLIYYGSDGYRTLRGTLDTVTPRDVLLYDFTGSGRDDIVIVQGRSDHAFTSESLIYPVDAKGIPAAEPRRYVTHNCVGAKLGDFEGSGKKSLVFINQQMSEAYGHVPVYIYLGGEDGYKPERRLEFPGHSAGSILTVDFDDDGRTDVLVLQNGEDQPFLQCPADLYFNSPDGFDRNRKTELPLPLAWGGHCIDSRRSGYLDVIACCGGQVRILYGGPEGYSEDRMTVLDPTCGEGGAVGALWPAIADLNGNGWPDLVVPLSWKPYSRIFWGGPEGYSEANSSVVPVENALTVRIADLNKDGYPDLVFGSRASYYRNVYQEGTVTIFWGGPEGYSGFNCCVLPSYQSNNITIADLNKDGWLDIFASSYFNQKERDINSFIFWNDRGHFSQTNKKRIFTHSSSAAWAGDFNEDGWVDLCVTHHRAYGSHRTESAIWWNGPEGFKEENRTWLPTIGPHDMVPNDMGNVMTRGPEEAYTTEVLELSGLRQVSWEAEIPGKTWVNCQIRTAASKEALEQTPFTGKDGTPDSRFENGEEIPSSLIHGAYVQVRLYLGAVNSGSSPRVTEIKLKAQV